MSLLLALPGELRNRIYEIAVNSCQDAPAHLRHISRGPFPANRPKDWCELTRAFLGLTQTCRQIRKEFLPIHQTRVKVWVDITGIEKYCSNILSHHQLGNVVIRHDESWDNYDQVVDIRELILLASHHHHVKVNFGFGLLPGGLETMLLPRIDAYDQLLHYIAERTHKVRIAFVRYGSGEWESYEIDALVIDVKKQYAEEWMRYESFLPLNEWFEDNPPETDWPSIWPDYEEGDLTEEHKKACSWTSRLLEWHVQVGLPVGQAIIPTALE